MESRNFHHLAPIFGLLAVISGWSAADRAIAEPPTYFARLIDEGNVTFDFYDPIRQPRAHRGYTTFQYDVAYRSSFQYQWADLPGARQISIQPKIDRIKCTMVNEVQLPATLNNDRRWANSLVQHEFDHVAMTVDPRVRMLIEHLCEATPKIARKLPIDTAISDELVERLIHEVVEVRYQAVLRLLIANENDLDVQTRHGTWDLRDRRVYFDSLFTEPNLKQQRFPFLAEVKPLLQTKSYREAELPYRFEH
jgi:hypothetical protein